MIINVQNKVQNLIDGIVSRGSEQGLQVAAYWKGDLIVNAWAGLANPGKRIKVDEHTLFPVFSTSKGITATLIHILAERGVLDYEAPIAKYWPDFAKKNKHTITLRQALDHTAGLPQMPDCKETDELNDWQHMCKLIANLEPLWPPEPRPTITLSPMAGSWGNRHTRRPDWSFSIYSRMRFVTHSALATRCSLDFLSQRILGWRF